jgi:hypothetical protein
VYRAKIFYQKEGKLNVDDRTKYIFLGGAFFNDTTRQKI